MRSLRAFLTPLPATAAVTAGTVTAAGAFINTKASTSRWPSTATAPR
jgi:hypothetical protein